MLFLFLSSRKLENKRVEQVLPGGGGGGDVAQIIYTHESICKHNKNFKRLLRIGYLI
jgi:hypothetical protein